MKNLIICFILFFTVISCNRIEPTQFTDEALRDVFTNFEDEQKSLKSILEMHKGQTLVIDVWASWCKDCLEGLPDIKNIQKEYTDITYLFFSVDKNEQSWKNAIKRHDIKGEHYFITSGWEGPFNRFLKLNWIPRYVVVDKQGNIKLFKAIKANNKLIKNL